MGKDGSAASVRREAAGVRRPRETLVVGERGGCASVAEASHKWACREASLKVLQEASRADVPQTRVREAFQKNGVRGSFYLRKSGTGVKSRGARVGEADFSDCSGWKLSTINSNSNQRVWDDTIGQSRWEWSDAHVVPPTYIWWENRQKVTAKKSYTFWWRVTAEKNYTSNIKETSGSTILNPKKPHSSFVYYTITNHNI